MKTKTVIILSCLIALTLSAQEEKVEEIVSIGSKILQKKIEVNATIDIVDKKDLKRLAPKDFISILSNYLGIDTSSNGGLGQYSSLFLRGSNSNHTLVKVNGVKINPYTAGGAAINNIDPSLISRIEIGSGPFSSTHGSEAIGGVINISTLPDQQNSSLQLSVTRGTDNFKKENFQKNWVKKDKSLNIFLLKSKSEGFPSLLSSSINNGYKNKSLGGSFNSKKDRAKINISTWLSKGQTEYLDFQSNPLSHNYENSAHSFSYLFEHKDPFLVSFNLSAAKDLIDQNQLNNLDQKDKIETDSLNFELMLSSPSDKDFSYAAIYVQEKQKVNYSSFGTYFQKNTKTNSFLTESKIKIKANLVRVKLRLSNHDLYGSHKSWNIGYKKNLNPFWSVRFNSGSAFRSPNSSELYGYGSNINLHPEISKGQEFAMEKTNDDSIFSIVAFNNNIKNLINFDFQESILKNIEHSNTKGFEIRYLWENKSINGRLLFRYQDPKDETGLQLLRRSKKSLSFNIYRDLSFGTLNFNLSAFDKRRDFGDMPLPKYHLLHLTFLKERLNQMSISLKVENILDKEYFTASGFNGYYQNQGRSLWLNATYGIQQ